MEPLDRPIESALTAIDHASSAYAELFRQARPVLSRYLVMRGVRPDDADDLIQAGFAKIWERRNLLDFSTTAEWLAYAKRVTDRLLIDNFRKHKGAILVNIEEVTVSSEGEVEFVEAISSSLDRATVSSSANALWLGEPPQMFSARLTLAKLLWVDQLPIADVCAVAGRLLGTSVVEDALVNLVSHPAVIRTIVFEILAPEPLLLTASLCGCSTNTMHEVIANPRAIGELSLVEVVLILSKAYFYEHNAAAVRRVCDQISEAQALALIDRIGGLLPFVNAVGELRDNIGQEHFTRALSGSGVWKRVAFHYAGCGLPHGDIYKWIGPVASLVGFALEPMTLHAWISNRRLIKELVVYINKENSEYLYG